MEGKSVQALKYGILFCLLTVATASQAQPPWQRPLPRQWIADGGLFLDPNRFTTAKDLANRALWLEMGFGREFLRLGSVGVGLEALGWSRLRVLSDFRFPVETADYFFGAYAEWGNEEVGWRARISHISSHLVDGTDSAVVGGSSSEYSREFLELSRQCWWGSHRDLYWSLGLRVIFHQVMKIESWISVPASLTWTFASIGPPNTLDTPQPVGIPTYRFATFLSTGDGPVWPTITGGLRLEREAELLSKTDLELLYQWGASWAGTDAGARASSIRLQLSLRDL